MHDPADSLMDRTYRFARDVRKVVNKLDGSFAIAEDSRRALRSSGSLAAHYLAAQEGLDRQGFVDRIKTCRRQARESQLWLELLAEFVTGEALEDLDHLVDEANQLTRIFASIVQRPGNDE